MKSGTKSEVDRSKSREIYKRAMRTIPGGVNSPVRAFAAVGVEPPLIIASAKGAEITDVDGVTYVDYLGAWGPMILGHSHPDCVRAIHEAASHGLGFGLATATELEFAELLQSAIPSLEKLRLVNSGTEATMSAIRLARGFTGRDLLVKFEGCYHGHADYLLVKSGSGLATMKAASSVPSSAPSSAGLPEGVHRSTLVLPYNDIEAVTKCFEKKGDQIAAMIVEPVAGNMGCVPPVPGFLKGLREICDRYGSLFIFDEVISGFRLAYGGAQDLYQIHPDLTTLSKIIGGGLPIGAFGGRADIMNCLAPLGAVYQAGTLAGNPVAVAAGMATIKKLKHWVDPKSGGDAYDYLEQLGRRLETGLKPLLTKFSKKLALQRVGSMFTLFFCPAPVRNWNESAAGDHSPNGPYAKFYRELLARGVLFPPSSFETAFLSLAHNEEIIDSTVCAIEAALELTL